MRRSSGENLSKIITQTGTENPDVFVSAFESPDGLKTRELFALAHRHPVSFCSVLFSMNAIIRVDDNNP